MGIYSSKFEIVGHLGTESPMSVGNAEVQPQREARVLELGSPQKCETVAKGVKSMRVLMGTASWGVPSLGRREVGSKDRK